MEITAEKNGDCYIVNSKPEFPSDLSVVTITGESVETLHNARIIECASIDERYWFAIGEMTPDELWRAEIEDALCELSMGE